MRFEEQKSLKIFGGPEVHGTLPWGSAIATKLGTAGLGQPFLNRWPEGMEEEFSLTMKKC